MGKLEPLPTVLKVQAKLKGRNPTKGSLKVVPYSESDEERTDSWEILTGLSGEDPFGESATFRKAVKKNKLRQFDVNGTQEDLNELIGRADNCYVRAWLWFAFPETQSKITSRMGYKYSKYLKALKISCTHVVAVLLCFVVQVAFPGLMLQQEYSRECEQTYDLNTDTTGFSTIETLQHMVRSAHVHSYPPDNTTIAGDRRVGCQDMCRGTGNIQMRCFAVLLALYAFGEMFEAVRECQVMMRLHANSRASHFARLILVLGSWAQLVSFVFLLMCTSALFLREPEYKDLLLNAVALTFVLEIDNKIEVQGRDLLTGIERKLVTKRTEKERTLSLACIGKYLLMALVQTLAAPLEMLYLVLDSVVVTLLIGSAIILMILLSSVYIAICI